MLGTMVAGECSRNKAGAAHDPASQLTSFFFPIRSMIADLVARDGAEPVFVVVDRALTAVLIRFRSSGVAAVRTLEPDNPL